jgi:hypothetical protein
MARVSHGRIISRYIRTMHRMSLVSLLVACGATTAPTSTAPTAPTSTAPTPAVQASDIAPQLFTVDQLRAGCPESRTIEFRMAVDGKPTTIEHWEFTVVSASQATIHAITRDESGVVLNDETGSSTWDELHQHGQFPAASTTFEDNVRITVPAGSFTTRLYVVKRDGVTQRFWFAPELPGPPVLFTTERDGKVLMHSEMLRAR